MWNDQGTQAQNIPANGVRIAPLYSILVFTT